jgi:DNA-binding transcriptional MerR regulator
MTANGNPRSPYLNTGQVATRYQVSPYTVREWARFDLIPHMRRPRSRRLLFLPAHLDAYDAGAELERIELSQGGRTVRPI